MLLRGTEQVGGAAVAQRKVSEPKKDEEDIHQGWQALWHENQPAPSEKVSTQKKSDPKQEKEGICVGKGVAV